MTEFAVFILSHGRADRVYTYTALRDQGYTGPVYVVVDNADSQVAQYQATFGDQVIVFDKAYAATLVDSGDNFNDHRSPLYARQMVYTLARERDIQWFLVLDDDYRYFQFRINEHLEYAETTITDLDRVFAAYLEFYQSIPAATITMAQSGDYFAGKDSKIAELALVRKAMQTFFCSTDREFPWMSRLNDDVTTYCVNGNRGLLFLTVPLCTVKPGHATQQNPGGITEAYLDYGTYVKSFYTVMYGPSYAVVSDWGQVHRRLHHRINWDQAVPKILSEDIKK